MIIGNGSDAGDGGDEAVAVRLTARDTNASSGWPAESFKSLAFNATSREHGMARMEIVVVDRIIEDYELL